MILVTVSLIVIVSDLVQFARWVAPSCVCINIVLDGIDTKLQCSAFCMKIDMKSVPLYVITFIFSLKWHVCVVISILVGLF